MKYRVRVEDHFDAAHFISGHSKCKQLHGHTWKVEVFFIKDKLDERGISLDFNLAKIELVTLLVDEYDHRNLEGKSAEQIAEEIYLSFKNSGFPIERVRVWEGEGKYVEVFE
jgi:6-pyruvoyltetrahydropterin/6-carboxytetrahydropterin synthase